MSRDDPVLRKSYFVTLFYGNFCEPGRAQFADPEENMGSPSQVVSRTCSILFSARFEHVFEPVQGPLKKSGINLFMTWLVQ